MLNLIHDLTKTVNNIMDKDFSVKSKLEVILFNKGLHSIVFHRFAHFFYKKKLFLLSCLISSFSRFLTGIEIHPGAKIGTCLFIDHGMGVVIGETAIVGDYVTIFHGVTLGATGKEDKDRHPIVGDNCLIGANASVLGRIHLAEGTKVGANAVVLKNTKPYSTIVGVK